MSQVRTNSLVPVGGIPAGASGGGIIQVVQTVKTDTFSNNNTTTFADITGLSASITPRSSSNKILIHYNVASSMVNGGYGFHIRLVRGSTNIALGDASGSVIQGTTSSYSASGAANYPVYYQVCNFLDSPATTSATTYKLQSRGWNFSVGTYYVNQSASEENTVNYTRIISTITLYEVSG